MEGDQTALDKGAADGQPALEGEVLTAIDFEERVRRLAELPDNQIVGIFMTLEVEEIKAILIAAPDDKTRERFFDLLEGAEGCNGCNVAREMEAAVDELMGAIEDLFGTLEQNGNRQLRRQMATGGSKPKRWSGRRRFK